MIWSYKSRTSSAVFHYAKSSSNYIYTHDLKKKFGQILLFFPGVMLTSEQICEMKMQLSKK